MLFSKCFYTHCCMQPSTLKTTPCGGHVGTVGRATEKFKVNYCRPIHKTRKHVMTCFCFMGALFFFFPNLGHFVDSLFSHIRFLKVWPGLRFAEPSILSHQMNDLWQGDSQYSSHYENLYPSLEHLILPCSFLFVDPWDFHSGKVYNIVLDPWLSLYLPRGEVL